MIYNVFDLGDAKAKDIMVPRVHVTFADVNSTFDELIDISVKTNSQDFLFTKRHRITLSVLLT